MKWRHWVAKHKTLVWILLSAFEIPVYSDILSRISAPVWVIVLISIFILALNYFWVYAMQGRLLNGPLQAWSRDGDPKPLYEVTERVLTYRNPKSIRAVYLIDHAVALREMGELQRAHDILTVPDADSLAPAVKVVYYNNLSDILDLLGCTEQAEEACLEMKRLYDALPETKQKQALKQTVSLALAKDLFRRQEYGEAMSVLAQIVLDNLPSRMDVYLLRGQIYLKSGETEKAKICLGETVRAGKGLYAVRIAQDLLDGLA